MFIFGFSCAFMATYRISLELCSISGAYVKRMTDHSKGSLGYYSWSFIASLHQWEHENALNSNLSNLIMTHFKVCIFDRHLIHYSFLVFKLCSSLFQNAAKQTHFFVFTLLFCAG